MKNEDSQQMMSLAKMAAESAVEKSNKQVLLRMDCLVDKIAGATTQVAVLTEKITATDIRIDDLVGRLEHHTDEITTQVSDNDETLKLWVRNEINDSLGRRERTKRSIVLLGIAIGTFLVSVGKNIWDLVKG